MALTAKSTPRLNPSVGAELGPVIAARQPILIESDWAIAGAGNEKDAAPSAPALPNNTSRREIAISCSRLFPYDGARLARCLGEQASAVLLYGWMPFGFAGGI